MVMTDPIADFLTHGFVTLTKLNTKYLKYLHQTLKKGIAEILKREGFVKKMLKLSKMTNKVSSRILEIRTKR